MHAPVQASIWDTIVAVFQVLAGMLHKIFLSPAGSFSLASLATALLLATLYLVWRRRHHKRRARLQVWLRALFPRRIWKSPSSHADVMLFLLNTLVLGLVLSWALLSYHFVDTTTNQTLIRLFGAREVTALPGWVTTGVLTIAIFLAFELGYYTDHYLAHRIPFLWEFHKVHHTAEVLTPITNFRVHPIDSLVFYNILALMMGITGGVVNWVFGKPIQQFSLYNSNVIILLFTYILDHLHHTSFWIAFTGIWGRIFVSPAHHQIHHSTNPAHFNKNMGSTLAIWDWMFGTLYIPSKKREKLEFGVNPKSPADHSLMGSLVEPVRLAAGHLAPAGRWVKDTAGQAVSRLRATAAPAAKPADGA